MPQSAAIICTRNRPHSLARTLSSLEQQAREISCLILVVDASDPQTARTNKSLLSQPSFPESIHLLYSGPSSLARQRNHGLDHLPSDVDIVFFLDDDVTLKPGYFHKIIDLFDQYPDLAGAGGYDVAHTAQPTSSARQLLHYLFLLDHPQPGRILPSGEASPPNRTQANHPISVEWLAGFSMAFRRSLLDRCRFDENLDGYSHYEDRDLTVRIAEHGRLMTHPGARLIHHRSPKNRHDARQYNYSMTTHLYWFVEKNVEHPLRKPAFWWAILGHLLALVVSTKPQKWKAMRGLLEGVRSILGRTHPLLRT